MILSLLIMSLLAVSQAKIIEVKNIAEIELWIQSSDKENGFSLKPQELASLEIPDDWSGRFWAQSGECSTSKCEAPSTMAEFKFNILGSDQYFVSLVEGFNQKVKITPVGHAMQHCRAAVCESPINTVCPAENQFKNALGQVIACKSTPMLFKKLCPLAITTLTDPTIFTCKSTTYLVLFG